MNDNYFPVADLKTRFGIGKQADINRRKHLNIEAKKINGTYVITKDELDLLDQLDQFLKSKNNPKMEDFVPNTVYATSDDVTNITSINVSLEPQSNSIVKTSNLDQPMVQLALPGFESLEEFIVEKCFPKLTTLVEKIASSNENEVSELRQLQEISEQDWWITTLQIKKLTGTTPKLKKGKTQWQRGCFLFTKVGKIGNQTAWKISRTSDP